MYGQQPPMYAPTAPPYAPPPQVSMPVAQPAPVVYQPNPPPSSQQQQSTTVVLGHPGGGGSNNNDDDVVGSPTFRDASVRCKCTNCRRTIFTMTTAEIGFCTWLSCFFFFICGCVLFCWLIPFCMDRFKDIRHTCPNCQTTVGVFKRM